MPKKRGNKAPAQTAAASNAVEEHVRITVEKLIEGFLADPNAEHLQFPISFTNVQRKFVHEYVRRFGLKSQSHGKKENRILTIYKRTDNTKFLSEATIEWSEPSQKLAFSLLNSFPVTQRERVDLQPGAKSRQPTNKIAPYRISVGSLSQPQLTVPPLPNPSQGIWQVRQSLPIFPWRQHILNTVSESRAVVISGETGSGKTTQVPQFILEDSTMRGAQCRIICTQPRRISAISVAERVAAERNEPIGHAIGYQIRLESRISPSSNLVYCTNGVLLRCLMGEYADDVFKDITHIIVDEVHERDKFSDFLMISLKRALEMNPHLKVILMSATIDSQVFTSYLNDCPLIEIPGRVFDVEVFFLEDVLAKIGYTNKQVERAMKETKLNAAAAAAASANDTEGAAATTMATDAENHEPVDEDSAAELDELLEKCWLNDDEDAYNQLFYLFEGENLDINYRHRETDLSALMVAAGKGKHAHLQYLIELGVNLSVVDKHGFTALDLARRMDHPDCAVLLENALANNQPPHVKEKTTADKTYENLLLEAYLANSNEEEIDHDLLLEVIRYIHHQLDAGSILVFLPGFSDILEQSDRINDELNGVRVFLLHSQMQTQDQREIFRPAPSGMRKIILSTNLGETSITIDDVIYVVDTGKVKQQHFDIISGSSCLTACWISQACAKQRTGRAGRVQPGVCYRLYSSSRFDVMAKHTVPELLRVPLTEICIQAKLIAQSLTIEEFLAQAIQPPASHNIKQSIKLLEAIGALDENERLTDLGVALGDLPVEVRLGKMLIYGVLLRCLDPVLSIVAALSVPDPFLIPQAPADRARVWKIKRELGEDAWSDHFILLRLFQRWNVEKQKRNERRFCIQNFVRPGTMDMMCGVRAQILGHLRSTGFVKSHGPGNIYDLNKNSSNWPLVKACITAGLYPNLARVDRKFGRLKSMKVDKVGIHPSSVMRARTLDEEKKSLAKFPTEWIVHEEKSRRKNICLVQTNTLVTPLTVALFMGPIFGNADEQLRPVKVQQQCYSDSEQDDDDGANLTRLMLDEWLKFVLDTNSAYLVYNLRQKLNTQFLKLLHNPRHYFDNTDNIVIQTIAQILIEEERFHKLPVPKEVGSRPRATNLNYGPQERDSPVAAPAKAGGNENWRQPRTNNNVSTLQSSQRQWQPPPPPPSSSVDQEGSWRRPPRMRTSQQHQQTGSRYFIVRAASKEQVQNTIRTNRWNFSSSIRTQLLRLARQSPALRIVVFFNLASNRGFCGAAQFYIQNDRYVFTALSDTQMSYNYARQQLKTSGLVIVKYLDEYHDGEEVAEETGDFILNHMLQTGN